MTATITTTKPFFLSSASGWKIDKTMQYEFGGLLFGNGTPFKVISVKGLLGRSSTADSVRISSGPGATPGLMTDDPKSIEFVIQTSATREESPDLIAAVEDAFQVPERWLNIHADDNVVRGAPLTARTCLAFKRDGWDDPRIIFCRCSNLDIDSTYDTTVGNITINVRLQADNPMKFSMATTQVSVHMHASDTNAEFEWINEGNYVNGYPMYVKIRCPGPDGYKNLQLYRKWENPFDPSGFSYDRLTSNFAWNGDYDVDFKQRITKPVGPLRTMSSLGWFRLKPGRQWIGVQRTSNPGHDGPFDVHFFMRHQWV